MFCNNTVAIKTTVNHYYCNKMARGRNYFVILQVYPTEINRQFDANYFIDAPHCTINLWQDSQTLQ